MRPLLVFVGLGNPGASYERTRHNLGFLAADTLALTFGGAAFAPKQKFLSDVAEISIGGASVLLVKPTTYMNRSGEAIKKIVDFYKLDAKTDVLVCCDDIDLPLGTFRFRMNGGPGTHNGLKSVVEIYGEDFPRLRIGFGPKPERIDLAAWVLSRLSEKEESEITHVLKEVPTLVVRRIESMLKERRA